MVKEQNETEITEEKPLFDREAMLKQLAEMTAEEKFRASRRLLFIAPDVPPIPPRPRRTDLRQLDEILDRATRRHDDDPGRGDGGRGRGRKRDSGEGSQDDHDQKESGSHRRRSRSRSRSNDEQRSETARETSDEPQKLRGSTRLEAKRQRRRDGRDAGRRRSVITESEFLARREAVDRKMIAVSYTHLTLPTNREV